MVLLRMLCHANVSGKFKMAAVKPGRNQKTYISASRPDGDAVPTANPPFSGSGNSKALLRRVPDVTGSQILKMAAANPEVLIYQLTDHIAMPFQRLSILGVQEVHGAISNTACCDFLDQEHGD